MIDLDAHFQLFADSQESEFIPLITEEDEKAMHKQDVPENMPLLSLRNTVLFPGVVIPITVASDPVAVSNFESEHLTPLPY